MAWDRRTLASLAACGAAHLAMSSCSGAEFSAGGAEAEAGAGGGGKASSGSGGKASAGASQGGKAGSGGNTSGGNTTGGAIVNPGTGGEPDPGAAGAGGAAPSRPELPAGGLLYWFASDVGVEAPQGSVATWKDQSGNGFNAFQLLPQLRPTLTTSDMLPLPVLNFDGIDDYLELPELTGGLSEGLSLFVVAGSATTNVCSAFIELSNGPEINDVHFGAHQTTLHYEVDAAVLTGLAETFPPGQVRLVEAHQSAPQGQEQVPVELRVNGTQAGSTVMPLPGAVPRVSNFLGRTLYASCVTFAGAIGELILYSRKVTPDERTAIETYLIEKWQCCK